MRSKNGEIVFDTLTDSDDFKWEYHDEKYISNKNSNSFIGIKDNALVIVNEKISEWKIIDDRYLFNEKNLAKFLVLKFFLQVNFYTFDFK
jgi:hypothetical protein